jgi:farnesyl-diphosphate farnesyltransferase
MESHSNVLEVLEDTSRTFFIPVSRLPISLQETVAAAYLCMRAIDEIEDHPNIDNGGKVNLLRKLSLILQAQTSMSDALLKEIEAIFHNYKNLLPEVTLRLGEWVGHAPKTIAPRIWDSTAAMADRMAQWVDRNWYIHTRADLDGYTYSVAGAVGLLMCDIWAWFDGGQIDRMSAIQFGRGLQAVNILRNRNEDLKRNVDLFPTGWGMEEMLEYARSYLTLAKIGSNSMPHLAYKYFVEIPLLLADATLDVLERGGEKLSRSQVIQIVYGVRT